jgi:redox-sensitive bicupin YhaK (pirin superfamily)
MKARKRPAAARGRTHLDWLDSRHTFSFGEYHDAAQMGFRALRVINDDRVEPGAGFGRHSHRDAEILSYVLEGRLEHKDSLGNGSVISAGDLQYMSAGDGVAHSEFNPSRVEGVHFLQIWLLPDESGGAPRYAEMALATPTKGLALLASGRAREGVIALRADADVLLGRLGAGDRVEHPLAPGRGAWIHVISGEVAAAGETLGPGDGLSVEEVDRVEIASRSPSELLLFDLR